MALYRRFAIYFYQYQKSRRGAAAGFGMIELRDGIVRIHITGRGSNAQSNLAVYGLLDAPDAHMGVHLGSMRAGQFACEKPMEDCGGRSFQELRGVVLCRRPGEPQAIAALWSGEFHAERFTEWKPEAAEKVAIDRNEPEETAAEPESPEADDTVSAMQEEQSNFPAEKKQSESVANTAGTEQTETEKGDRAAKLTKAVQREAEADIPLQESAAALSESRNSIITDESEPETAQMVEALPQNQPESSMSTSCEQTIAVNQSAQSEETAALVPTTESKSALLQEETTSQSIHAVSHAEETGIPEDSDLHITSLTAPLYLEPVTEPLTQQPSIPHIQSILWRQLERQYPKMRLQIEGQPIEALRIRPCDISRLPKTDWRYGCNHFLARHYNQYRCLILGRRSTGGSWQCFLGVPGNETFSEEQEAEEAGFGQFLRADHVAAGWPQGYWITEIPEMN